MNTEQERCVKCNYCDLCIKMLRDHLYGKDDKE